MKAVVICSALAGLAFVAACGEKSPPRADARETVVVSEVAAPERGIPAEVRPVTFTSAESTFKARQYEDAVTQFTTLTETQPESAIGFYMLGLSEWKVGDHKSAVTALRRSIELDSTHVKSYLNLSRVLIESGKPDEARVCLDQVLAIDPTSAEAQRLVGRVHESRKETELAVLAYRRALVLDSTDVWSMNNIAMLSIEQGQYEEALPPLARAVELVPGAPVFRNNLGIALERTGRFVAAAAAYSAALASDSTYPKSKVNLERVTQLSEAVTVTPVDLTELARKFVQQIEAWRAEASTPTTPEQE